LKVRKTLSSKEEKDKFRDIVISKIAERERVREIERKNLVGEMAASIHDRKAVDAEAARRTAFNPRAEQRPWEKEQE
jgi:hypothetical protein